MKNFLLYFIIIVFVGCSQPSVNKEQIKDTHEKIGLTSEMLKELPATFKGVTGDPKYDSVLIILRLNEDLNCMVSKQYFSNGQVVINLNDKGTWMLQGENVISTLKNDSTQETENFQLLSDQVVRLLDNSSHEFADGKNYDLNRIPSASN